MRAALRVCTAGALTLTASAHPVPAGEGGSPLFGVLEEMVVLEGCFGDASPDSPPEAAATPQLDAFNYDFFSEPGGPLPAGKGIQLEELERVPAGCAEVRVGDAAGAAAAGWAWESCLEMQQPFQWGTEELRSALDPQLCPYPYNALSPRAAAAAAAEQQAGQVGQDVRLPLWSSFGPPEPVHPLLLLCTPPMAPNPRPQLGPRDKNEIAARLDNLDLGCGFF